MSSIDRRQGLWLLAGSAVATLVLGARAVGQATAQAAGQAGPPRGDVLALIEKTAGRIAFYEVPDGRRVGALSLGTQPQIGRAHV